VRDEIDELRHLVAAVRRHAHQRRELVEHEHRGNAGDKAGHHGVRNETHETS